MKRKAAWCLLGSMFLVGAVWSQTGSMSRTSTTVRAIVALEHKWLQSQQMNNADLIAPSLADNFIQTSSEGKVTTTKAAAVAEAKSVKWRNVEYENVTVTVFGDTAVAIGGFRGKGTDASGKPIDETSRFTDTWVKMPNGQWQCVASQDTLVK